MNTDKDISYIPQPDGSVDIYVPPQHVAEFKELVRRGANTWEGRSISMRIFTEKVSGLYQLKYKEWCRNNPDKLTFGEKKVVVPIRNNFLSSGRTQDGEPICQGHPETCGCAYHNR